jgi:sugar phosphate permease
MDDAHSRSPDRRRWVVLFVGFFAMAAGCSMQYGMPYLIPALRAEGLSLAQAGLLVSAPVAGLLLTLVLWGAAADRWGERRVLGSGLTLAAAALAGAVSAPGLGALGAALVCAGAAGASVHAASGRLVLGWFAAHERGLAMAVRQTAQPIGIAVAALALPVLGASGLAPAFGFLGGLCLVAAVLVLLAVRDPARPAAGAASGVLPGSPYRTPVLWRIHATSALLVVPQFAIATFGLAHLVDEQGWQAASAGRAFALAALGGALARLLAGIWSDRVGSRLRPLRLVAAGTGAIMLAAAVMADGDPLLASLTVLLAAVVTVSPNGLAYTAVAEQAGYTWAGRALGIQNTVQNAFAAAVPPVLGALIGAVGYGHTFMLVAVFPVLAIVLVPVAAERAGRAERAVARSGRPAA